MINLLNSQIQDGGTEMDRTKLAFKWETFSFSMSQNVTPFSFQPLPPNSSLSPWEMTPLSYPLSPPSRALFTIFKLFIQQFNLMGNYLALASYQFQSCLTALLV